MRSLGLLLLLITACDLQPAKQKKAPAAEPPAAPTPSAPPAPAEPPVDAGVKPVRASAECKEVAAHLSKLVIDAMTDEAAKAAQQANEAQMIKSVAETCSRDKWTDAGRACLLASKTVQDTERCDVKPPPE